MNKRERKNTRKVSATNTGKSTATTRAGTRSEDFNPDYAYVIKDLKRIGILAGSFITVLVILSFFLN